VVAVLPTVTTTEPTVVVLVNTNSSTLPLVLAFTVTAAEPDALVAPVSVVSRNAFVAVAETVVPAATPETEMLRALDDVMVSPGTGRATAVAEVVPPEAEAPATVSVCVLAEAARTGRVVAARARDSAIASFLIVIYIFLLVYLGIPL